MANCFTFYGLSKDKFAFFPQIVFPLEQISYLAEDKKELCIFNSVLQPSFSVTEFFCELMVLKLR